MVTSIVTKILITLAFFFGLVFSSQASTLAKTNKEVVCLASVIHDEARGEPISAKLAVAAVVMNRVKHQKYPNTICKVVYQSSNGICQFSGMCKKKIRALDKNTLEIAHGVVFGLYKDPTRGATHFHNNTVSPHWSKNYVKTARIGKHTFYKERLY